MVQETNNTVGKIMRERRYLLGATLDEMAEEIGIPTKHLRKIEKDAWAALPSPVYTQGFIKKYSRALGMDVERVIERYKKEAPVFIGQTSASKQNNPLKNARNAFLHLSSGITRKVAAVSIFILLLGYMSYQLSIVFAEPALTVSEPSQDEMIVEESAFTLSGSTDTGALLYLNNEKLEVRPDGTFEKEVDLLPGINVLEIKAESRFGESSSVVRTVIFKESELQPVADVQPTILEGTSTSTVFEERSAGVGTTTDTQ